MALLPQRLLEFEVERIDLLTDVIGDVLVVITREPEDVFRGQTRYRGEVRGWTCSDITRNELSRMALGAITLYRGAH